jgi:hypothetical protein
MAIAAQVAVRRLFINLILAGFLAASAYDIVVDQEHWPFSQYPMFSVAWNSPTFAWHRLFAVTATGREFPLDENRFITPFDQSRLPKAFRQILTRSTAKADTLVALKDVLARYEALRVAGRHSGPAATGIRLYELEWSIDAQAANVEHPDRKRLLAEVWQ